MPKPLKKAAQKPPVKPKRATDPNLAAHSIIAEHMASAAEQDEPAAPLDFQAQYRAHMAKLGEKGGKIGGKRRLKTMTADQRSKIALKAAMARWNKAKKP